MGPGMKYGIAAAGTLMILTLLSWSTQVSPASKAPQAASGSVMQGRIGGDVVAGAPAVSSTVAAPELPSAGALQAAVGQAAEQVAERAAGQVAATLVEATTAALSGAASAVAAPLAVASAEVDTAPATFDGLRRDVEPASVAITEAPAHVPAPTTMPSRRRAPVGCETTAPDRSKWHKHQVQSGESLYAIAARYLGDGGRWKEVLAANPRLKSASRVRAGLTLLIPDGQGVAAAPTSAVMAAKAVEASTAPAPSGKTYLVQSGDTLSSIARRQLGGHGHWKRLYAANRDLLSSPDMLRAGQTLKLPGEAH